MMENSDFEVIDRGMDISPEKFVATIREEQPQLVACRPS